MDIQAMYNWVGTDCKLQILFPFQGLDESKFVSD